MQIKLLVSVATIALVAGLASAEAMDHIAIVGGVPLEKMTGAEMRATNGSALLQINPRNTSANSISVVFTPGGDLFTTVSDRADGFNQQKGLDKAAVLNKGSVINCSC